jgi:glutathione S-transferase
MILIGQYDSPFVRRVGIALTLYDVPFEHRTWSAFSDADKLRRYNPLTRVPTLVLDDGTVLVESHAMLDYLDSLVPAERRMFPAAEPARHRAIRVATLATGLGDKAVSIFYEKRLHDQTSALWLERCRTQVSGALAALESDRAARRSTYWFGEAIGHGDIAVACVLRFVDEALPGLLPMADCPALMAHAARLEALPAFQQVRQRFIAPA